MFFNKSSRYALIFVFVVGILAAGIAVAQEGEHETPHWTYEGEEGPEHWGELAPEYVQCVDGTAQSPIDITGNIVEANIANIEFHYGGSALNILNNGHTIQVNTDAGSSINYNGLDYDLLQFHFHHPSEHTVNGEPAAMEIHFVHRDPDGGILAVVGVMLVEGEENPAYADIFANLPAEASEVETRDAMLDLMAMLPQEQTFFTYQGSLTTPPCSEIVRWLLLDTPVTLSAEQIAAFAAIFENNARPVQEVHNRDVLHDTNP